MEKPLNSSVKNPVSLFLGDHKADFLCGCKVVDITFPNIISPEERAQKPLAFLDEYNVGEIRFKNYYVAYLTIKAKYRGDQTPRESGEQAKWKTCLKRYRLMPDPHAEAGSHDFFSFTNKQFRCEMNNVLTLRLILQQPSPVWREFKLEDLRLFRSATGPKASPLPAWLLEQSSEKSQRKTVEGVPDLEELSASLQQLWALGEEVQTNQTAQSLGRFDVDGCYDINLLAYT